MPIFEIVKACGADELPIVTESKLWEFGKTAGTGKGISRKDEIRPAEPLSPSEMIHHMSCISCAFNKV